LRKERAVSRRTVRTGRQGALAVLVLLVAACGQAATTASGEAPTTPVAATAPDTPTSGSPAPSTAPTEAAPPAPTASAAAAAAADAGEEIPGPEAGTSLAVVGVASDDVLHVRDGPGTDHEVFGEFAPMADDVVVTGTARLVDGAVWYEVEGGAVERGWVNARYLAHLGETIDLTSQLTQRPTAATMDELADAVAALRLPADAEGAWSVISDGPSIGDLGEVVVDVVGLPDDAVRGERLHVFANPEADGFALRTVERTLLCARGVSDGLCV
jgi:Bacterial SH3 domain